MVQKKNFVNQVNKNKEDALPQKFLKSQRTLKQLQGFQSSQSKLSIEFEVSLLKEGN